MAEVKIFPDRLYNVFRPPWAVAELAPDLLAEIVPLTFGRARIVTSRPGDDAYLDMW